MLFETNSDSPITGHAQQVWPFSLAMEGTGGGGQADSIGAPFPGAAALESCLGQPGKLAAQHAEGVDTGAESTNPAVDDLLEEGEEDRLLTNDTTGTLSFSGANRCRTAAPHLSTSGRPASQVPPRDSAIDHSFSG